MSLINNGWQPLNKDRPDGDDKYYLVTHYKTSKHGGWSRPEVYPWNRIDFYREKYEENDPMVKPIKI